MIKQQSAAIIPTQFGNFNMLAFSDSSNQVMPHLALVSEKFKAQTDEPVLVRIHSECITGDLFGSYRCDCGEQLDQSLALIGENGGVLIYLRQEGRGIGIINKLKAYRLQDKGMDTVEANVHLGLPEDGRYYDEAIFILKSLGIKRISLLTNNPDKLRALDDSDIVVESREPLIIPHKDENVDYFKTKKEKFGHFFD